MVTYMGETDIVHLFFPWLLVLAVTFGALQKYELFEDELVDAAVSLSIAFLSIGGIYFFAPEGIFVNLGAVMAFASLAALSFMIVMAVAGIDLSEMTDEEQSLPLIGGLSILGVGLLIIGGSALGIPEAISQLRIEASLVEDILMPLMLFGFLTAVIYLTSRE